MFSGQIFARRAMGTLASTTLRPPLSSTASASWWPMRCHFSSSVHRGLSAKVEEDDEITRSIAEAIARFKAEESLRIADKLEEARREGEQAALARAQQDLILQQRKKAFEEWERNVAVAKKREEAIQKEKEEKAAMATQNEPKEVDTDTAAAAATEVVVEEGPVHPVLGKTVADFGYKRLHIVSISVLENVPVWEKQRIFRYDRSKTMATDKMKTLHLGLPGVICLFEEKSGQLSVLDGQHRIGMMKILAEKGTEGIDLEQILVEVYPAPTDSAEEDSSEHATEIFAEINKAEPVKKVDIFATKGDRKILVGGVEALKERFSTMFSPSLKCRPPNVNEDNLRDGIFASNVLKDHDIKSAKALYEWMLEQNEALKAVYEGGVDKIPFKVNEKALAKANKNGFYLGLDPTYGWMSSNN